MVFETLCALWSLGSAHVELLGQKRNIFNMNAVVFEVKIRSALMTQCAFRVIKLTPLGTGKGERGTQ